MNQNPISILLESPYCETELKIGSYNLK